MVVRKPFIGPGKLPVLRIFLPFVLGVAAGGTRVDVPGPGILLPVISGTWLAMFMLFRRSRMARPGIHLLFGGLVVVHCFGTGLLQGGISRPSPPDLPVNRTVLARGRITGEPVFRNGYWRTDLRMDLLAGKDSLFRDHTRLSLYMRRLPDSMGMREGEEWQLEGILRPIRNNGNPGETDYAAISGRNDCWFRFFVSDGSLRNKRVSGSEGHASRSALLREEMARHWQGDPGAVMLLEAVCLGDRSRLSEELREAYAGAGGMHLLAVSGLHIGLIWWVLNHLFSPLVRLTGRELFRVVPILILLWGYAWMTGMSPPVSRSVTMFTLFTLSRMLHRRPHPVQTILVAALLMILAKPGGILEVGFQLSYMAVLGIVILFPLLRRFPFGRIRNRILRWIWDASAVSLAAQMATAPLVIHYFRQYPTYSLVTNLVAVPMLGLLIALFVVSAPFSFLGWFTVAWNRMLLLVASGLNHTMEFIAGLPAALLQTVASDPPWLLTLLWIPALLLTGLAGRRHLYFFAAALGLLVLLGYRSLSISSVGATGELGVAHFRGGTLLVIREGARIDCYARSPDTTLLRIMRTYASSQWGAGNHRMTWAELDAVNGHSVLRGSVSACYPLSSGVALVGNDRIRLWHLTGSPPDRLLGMMAGNPGSLLLLSGEPALPEQWIKDMSAVCPVILDGTNRSWYTRRISDSHPLIHATSQRGAFWKTW